MIDFIRELFGRQPHVGDQYVYKNQDPFKSVEVEVLAVQDGFVQYVRNGVSMSDSITLFNMLFNREETVYSSS